MATAEQIKALLRSHVANDNQKFYSVAFQIAAREARQGHCNLANDIKLIIEKAQKNESRIFNNKIDGSKDALQGLLKLTYPTIRANSLVLSEEVENRLCKVLEEQNKKALLAKYGLHPRRKLLFTGYPGTGKTMSAAVLASELNIPLYTIVLDNLITRFMGETAAKLRLVFDHIRDIRGVYLFDEFDSIGTQRGGQNDVGEIRRVLNSFLLFVEQDSSESVIVAATNHPEMLDKALHRRFDDIIKFEKPEGEQIKRIIENKLSMFGNVHVDWQLIISNAIGLSSAEVTRSCEDAAKEAVLKNDNIISTELLLKSINRRKVGF